MTTARQAELVRHQLEAAVEGGSEILAGGARKRARSPSPPTVLKLEREDTPLLREETFGPVLPVIVVEGRRGAIARTNASRFALTTSLWTRGYERAHALARRLRSGVVTINNHGFTGALPAAPWTGAGDSGYGVTSSPHALAEPTRPRFLLEDRSRAKSELWWYPIRPRSGPSPSRWRGREVEPDGSAASAPSSSSSPRSRGACSVADPETHRANACAL